MIKYLKLYRYFVKFSLIQAMQFRFDFFFRIIMDCMFYLVNILFYLVLFEHTGGIGGWTVSQVLIFTSSFLMMDAIQMTITSNGVWMIPNFVNKGELDYYLLRPVSSLFFLSTRDFAFNSFVNFLVTIGIMVWAFARSEVSYPFAKILLFVLLTFSGTYLFILLRILFLTPVFWTHSGRGLEAIFWTADKIAERPDAIYRGWVRKVLVSILPFAVISSFPARALFEADWISVSLYCVGIVVVFHFITMAVWNFGLKNYSSASS